jgi:hypothetical protein
MYMTPSSPSSFEPAHAADIAADGKSAQYTLRQRVELLDGEGRVDLFKIFHTARFSSLSDDTEGDAELVLSRDTDAFHAVVPKKEWGSMATAVDLSAAWGHTAWNTEPARATCVALGRMSTAYVQYAKPLPLSTHVTLAIRCFSDFE